MDESTNKGLESKGSDAEIQKPRSIGIRPGGYRRFNTKAPEVNDNYAGSGRMVVKGYDTSPPTPREGVEEALRKHFASRGIKLIHVYVPVDYDTLTISSCAFIYVYEEYEAEALKLQGSDMGGGRNLEVTSYPFEDNHLDHVFRPCNPLDDIDDRTLNISGLDTSLDKDDLEEKLLEYFPESGILDICNGLVVLVISGLDNMDKALKLSGRTVLGSKIAVTTVFPLEVVRCGLSSAARFALGKKMIKTTD